MKQKLMDPCPLFGDHMLIIKKLNQLLINWKRVSECNVMYSQVYIYFFYIIPF